MSLQLRLCAELLKNLDNLEDNYLRLYSIFGELFVRALELLDTAKFTLYAAKSRKLLKVRHKNEEYTLFPGLNYCSCKSFKYQTLLNRKHVCCKHILAGFLLKATPEIITEQQMSDLIKSLFED